MKILFISLAVGICLFTANAAVAANLVVANTNDSGPGSLREALSTAGNNFQDDTITFDPAVFNVPRTIALTSGELVIQSDIGIARITKIVGPGADLLTLDGNNNSRIFHVNGYARAEIDGVKMVHGNGRSNGPTGLVAGGAIYVERTPGDVPALILRNSILTENSTAGGSGGGIAVDMPTVAIVENCAIFKNTATNSGGGIVGTSLIINSTISGNTTNGVGGGVSSAGEIVNSTVAYNKGVGGAYGGTLRNSIVAYNAALDGTPADALIETFQTAQNSIIGYVYVSGPSWAAVDPHLDAELRTFGTSPIPVHALGADSPAIDRGSDCVLKTIVDGGCVDRPATIDARGMARPQDGDGDGSAHVDIGAFEITRSEAISAPAAKPDLRPADDLGPSNADNVTGKASLNFDVTGLNSGSVIQFLRNGTVIDTKTATGPTITFTDTALTISRVYSYSIREVVDGRPSLPGPAVDVSFDNNAPVVFIARAGGQAAATNASPLKFTVQFREPVYRLSASSFSFAGSTANTSNTIINIYDIGDYAFDVTVGGMSDGTVVFNLPQGTVQDLAGNGNAAPTILSNSVFYDGTPSSVTIDQAPTQADPTNSSSVTFRVAFSEPVTDFTSADVSLVGSTANAASVVKSVVGTGANYTIIISNINTPGGTIVASIPAQAALDSVGNRSLASTSTDNSVFVDTVAPTVGVARSAGTQPIVNNLPLRYSITFSEPVTDFDASDITLTATLNGVSQNAAGYSKTLTGSGSTYTLTVDNIPATNGLQLTASVPASAARDAVGNASTASPASLSGTITYDNVAPTVVVAPASGQPDPTSAQPIKYLVVFSEAVTGLEASDLTFAGSTADTQRATVSITPLGANAFTVSVGNVSAGKVRLAVVAGAATDLAGNPSLGSNAVDIQFAPKSVRWDYDGDGKSDVSIYRPTTGVWSLSRSQAGFYGQTFGSVEDKIVPADYDGDGKTDLAVFRPSNGMWYIANSGSGTYSGAGWGSSTDIPAPGDFDGDGKADIAIFRPVDGTWWINQTGGGGTKVVQYGQNGDVPVVGDYDGDGKADIAVFRPSTGVWSIGRSSAGEYGIAFGQNGDKVVQGDYDGDGKTDVAVFRPSTAMWYVANIAANTFSAVQFGNSTDIPVPGDYDGDGKTDQAVFRPSDGNWWLNRSTAGVTVVQWGQNGDKPTPSAFVN